MKKKYRNEWKYCCSSADLRMLQQRIAVILTPDKYMNNRGQYEVHSLYFDDYTNTCAKDNEAGVGVRYKYRIRYYNDNCDSIYLERKEKLNGRCYKERCQLTISEYEMIIAGNVSGLYWDTSKKLLKKFCYEIMTRQFRPKVIIDYERIAYIEPITNIRVTIDKNISASDDIESFIDGNYQRYPIQEKNRHVLEVKFDAILPGYIKNMICGEHFQQSSFSKYYYGRLQIKQMSKG